jgi:hypothetical protein
MSRKPLLAAAATLAAAESRRVVDYWTPARIRNAVPADRLVADRSTRGTGATVERGTPTVVGPRAKPSSPSAGADGTGGYYTGGGTIVQTTGKVFFPSAAPTTSAPAAPPRPATTTWC